MIVQNYDNRQVMLFERYECKAMLTALLPAWKKAKKTFEKVKKEREAARTSTALNKAREKFNEAYEAFFQIDTICKAFERFALDLTEKRMLN